MSGCHYVYIYYDPTRSYTPFYVGKGKTLGVVYRHVNGKSHSKTMKGRLRTLNEQGVVPGIGIVVCSSDAEARSLETKLIAEYGRANLGSGPLLNLTDGGDGEVGRVVSDATRKKLSAANSGVKRGPVSPLSIEAMRAARRRFLSTNQIVVSDETKAKMRESKIGKPRPDVSLVLKGKPKPPGFAERLSKTKTGVPRKKVVCPHCGKVGGVGNMTRWHFDNCKQR